MNADDFDLLVTRWLTGETSTEDEDRLAEALLADEQARLRFAELADQEAALRVVADSVERAERIRGDAPEEAELVPRPRAARRSALPRVLFLAAAALIAIGIAAVLLLPKSPDTVPTAPGEAREIVRLPEIEKPSAPPSAPPEQTPASRGAGRPDVMPPSTSRIPAPRTPVARPAPTEPDRTLPVTPKPPRELPPRPARETKTAAALGRLAWLRGSIVLGGNRGVAVGTALREGDRLETRTGLARVELGEKAVLYANKGTVVRLHREKPKGGDVPVIVLERGEIYLSDSGANVRVVTRDAVLSPVGTRFGVRRASSVTTAMVEEGSLSVFGRTRKDVLPGEGEEFAIPEGKGTPVPSGQGVRVRVGAPPRVAPFQGRVALWRFAPGMDVLWNNGFDEISGWEWNPYHPKGSVERELHRAPAKSGTRSFRLKYRFPDVRPGAAPDVWNENFRALGFPVRIPASATKARIWVRVLSASPGAKLYFDLGQPSESWSTVVKLDALPKGWQPVVIDLLAPENYWKQGEQRIKKGKAPPVNRASVKKVQVGFNYGDCDVLLDDLEFVDSGPQRR